MADAKSQLQTMVVLAVLAYGGLVIPNMPTSIDDMLSMPVTRLAVLFVIFYIGTTNPKLSILLTVAFFFTLVQIDSRRRQRLASEMSDRYQASHPSLRSRSTWSASSASSASPGVYDIVSLQKQSPLASVQIQGPTPTAGIVSYSGGDLNYDASMMRSLEPSCLSLS